MLRDPDESRAYSGQALVLFALMSLVLLGILGLALDVGYDLAQRRSLQNIADAAALQGAAAIHRNATTPETTLMAEMTALARLNGLPDPDAPAATATLTCRYLNNAGADLGPCGASIPAAASGVRVRVAERHPCAGYFAHPTPLLGPLGAIVQCGGHG